MQNRHPITDELHVPLYETRFHSPKAADIPIFLKHEQLIKSVFTKQNGQMMQAESENNIRVFESNLATYVMVLLISDINFTA